MTLKHVVTDLHKVYLTEMEAKIKPKSTAGAGSDSKASGGSEGGTAEDQTKKAARQLAYDTRYKARRDDIPLEKAFTQTLQNSSASSPVKELAKGMLFGGGQKEEVERISEAPQLPPEVFAALQRLEKKRKSKGDTRPGPLDKKEGYGMKKKVAKESIGSAIDKTFSAAGEVADTAIKLPVKAVGYAAGLKKGLKKQLKKGQNKANEETQQESIGSAVDKTFSAAGEVADTAIKLPVKAVGYVAGLKKGLKKQAQKGQRKANEHHEKDAEGKVIEHDVEDTSPSSIEEAKAKKAGVKKGKDKVLVTPVKGQGKQYRRYADAKKKYELRKNPQISSVTGTSYGKTYDEKPEDKKNPGKFPSQKKAKKDFDGDGKLESPKAEWKGSKDKAIKKAMAKKVKKEEFSNWKEEFDLTEIIKKESKPKKIQELKGKNTIIINPKLEEGIETLGGYVLGVDELTNEEVANIDELKSTTLSNYITKATADSLQKASSSGVHSAYDGADSKKATQKRDKAWKRAKYISKAGTKLAIRAIQGGQQKEDVEVADESMKQARKNVGASTCWDGYKAKGTKKKGGKTVPNCVKEDEVSEELHPSVKRIDAMSKANVAKQAAKASADKSAREKSAAAFQAHKKATLAKGGRPVDALDSWNKKKANEGVDPRGGGKSPDLSVKQQNTERKQTELEREKIAKKRQIMQQMRQQAVSQGKQPSGHTAREEVEIDERLGGKGYSKTAMKGSIHPPSQKSTGDWEDSDRGEGNKAKRRAGEKVKAKSPTYTAYVKNKKQNEALDPKKIDAGSAPADQQADDQIANKEKKVAIMKRQILQKKMQAVRSGAKSDIVAHVEPEGQVLEGKKKDDTYDEPNWEKRKANNEKARKDLMKGPKMKNPHFEAYRVLAKDKGEEGKPSQFSYKDEKDAKKFAGSIKKGGGRATVSKEERDEYGDPKGGPKTSKKQVKKNLAKNTPDEQHTTTTSEVVNYVTATVQELNRYEKETGKSSGSMNMPKGKPTKKGGDSSPVMQAVRTKIRKETGKPEGQQKKAKGVKSDAGTGKYLEKQKAKKDHADKVKKAGFKNAQAYADTMARYGGESNYKAGRGLGT